MADLESVVRKGLLVQENSDLNGPKMSSTCSEGLVNHLTLLQADKM